MENLPSELLLKIFSYLPWTKRISLEAVCKRWLFIFRLIATRRSFPTATNTSIHLKIDGSYYTRFRLVRRDNQLIVIVNCNEFSIGDLVFLFRRIPAINVRISRGRFYSDTTIERFLNQHVRRLELVQLPAGYDVRLLQQLPLLRKLVVVDMDFALDQLQLPNLKSLAISDQMFISTNDILAALGNCPQLHRISLYQCQIDCNGASFMEVCKVLNERGPRSKVMAYDTSFTQIGLIFPGCKIEKVFAAGEYQIYCQWNNLELLCVIPNAYVENEFFILP